MCDKSHKKKSKFCFAFLMIKDYLIGKMTVYKLNEH